MALSNEQRISFAVDYRVDTTSLQNARKSLQELQKMSLETFNSIGNNRNAANPARELSLLKQNALELEQALARSFNADLGVTNVQRLRNELSRLPMREIGERFAMAGAAGQNAFNTVAGQALSLNNTLKQTGPILTKIQQTLTNALSWNLVTGAFNQITKSISQAWGYSKNLDNSLNNIRIITRQSAEEMERFAQTAQKTAKGLGQGTVDYTDAALIYYQQGLSDEEVAKKTETTLKTANVTGKSAADVSQLLTAVWNGYKVDADEAELYVDKLAAVASTTAADLGELSTAMSKVASVASTTGVDIDQLNAQISTIISVTRQAPESVGTALKTIYSRIGDLQVDGVDEFGVSLGKISSKLKTMGVDILDKNGDMREMGVVFEEVADKWANWTSAQKQAAAVALGGSRQYTNLFALFENWGDYEKTLTTSSKAIGTLQEQQDVYAERLTTHLQQLRTAWEGVYDSAFDEKDAVKIVDKLTSIVETIEKFFDTVGGGIPVIKLLGSMLLSTFSTKIATGFTNFIENSLISLRNFTNQQERAQRQVENMMRNLGVQNQNFSQYQITSLADTSRMFRSRQSVMTEDELNRVNSSMERTIQLENQMNTNAEEVRKTRTFLQGLGMNFTDDYSLQQNLDLQRNQQTNQVYGQDFQKRQNAFNQIMSQRGSNAFGRVDLNFSREFGNLQASDQRMAQVVTDINQRSNRSFDSEDIQEIFQTQTRNGLQFFGQQLNTLGDNLQNINQRVQGALVSGLGNPENVARGLVGQRDYGADAQVAHQQGEQYTQEYNILREAARIQAPASEHSRATENLATAQNQLDRLNDERAEAMRQVQLNAEAMRQHAQENLETELEAIANSAITREQDALTEQNRRAAAENAAQANVNVARRNLNAALSTGDQDAITQAYSNLSNAQSTLTTAQNELTTAQQAYNQATQEATEAVAAYDAAQQQDITALGDHLAAMDSNSVAYRDSIAELNNYNTAMTDANTAERNGAQTVRDEYDPAIQEARSNIDSLNTRMGELRAAYEQLPQVMQRNIQGVSALDVALREQRDAYQLIGGEVQGVSDAYIQNSRDIAQNIEDQNVLQRKLVEQRQIFNQMREYGLIDDQAYDRVNTIYNHILDSNNQLKVSGETLREDLHELTTAETEELTRVQDSFRQANETLQQQREQQLDSARAELQQITTQQQDLMRTLNMRQVIQTTTQLATGMTSLASSATMFKNAWTNIMSNDDLSTWEKMVQLLGSVGPMLIGMAPQIKNLGSIIAKGAVAVVDAGEAERAAAMSIEARRAAIDRSNLTEQQRAIAQAKHINLTGQEITVQEAEIIATEEQIAAQKRYAEVSALSMNALLVVISAAVVALAWGLSKMRDAQKELEESRKKISETVEEITKRNKELRETVEDNAKAFDEWEDLWESFKKGKVAVDDVKTSMENLIDQLGYSDDLEYQRLLRIAEYTQDYSELERKLDDIISKQKQVASGTYDDDIRANRKLLMQSAERNKVEGAYGAQTIIGANKGNEASKYMQDSGLADIITKTGMGTVDVVADGGIFGFSIAASDYTEENIRQLQKYREEFKKAADSSNEYVRQVGQDYLQLIDATAGTLNMIDNSELEKAIDDTLNNIKFSRPEGTEKEQLLDIEKQVQSTIQAIKDAYEKEIEDKDLKNIELRVRNKFLGAIPDSKEMLDKTDVLMNDIKTKINEGSESFKLADLIDPDTGWFVSNEDVAQISEQLTGIGADALKDIDWDSVISDTELFPEILAEVKEKGELSDETLKAVAKHLTEAAQATRELTADFDVLGATWDDVNKKLEKNSLTDRNLRSSKEFQSLIDDETIKQIRTFYGAASDVGKAIGIITNEDISSSSQRWREAWEVYGEAIKNADIRQSLQDIEEKTEKIGNIKKGEINIQVDAYDYYKVMDDILAEDYDIDVNIHGRIDAELENIKSDLDDSVKLVTKIGEGFTLSANELNDFADDMPEVLDEMQVLSDGSIQLSQTAIESAKKAAIEKANEEIDSEIQVIKAQKAVVEHKKETVEEMIKIAQSMANGEYTIDTRLKEAQDELNKKALDIADDDKLQSAIAEGALHKKQLEELSKYYEAGLLQTQDYVEQRDEMLATYENFKKKDHFDIKTFADDLGLDLYDLSGGYYYSLGKRHNFLSETSIDNQKKLGEHLLETFNAQKDDYQHMIDSYDTDIKVMEAYKKNYKSTWDTVGKAKDKKDTKDKNKDAKDKDKDAKDKQSNAEAKLIDLLEEEVDAYHDINILIKELDTNLSRLQKRQSKLYGKDLIENLKQQGELLDQQISNYEEKIRLSQMELSITKQRLQAEGVQFNDDGTVSNYSAAMQNKINYIRDLQIRYNAMSAEEQENFKDTLDEAEKAYDKFKEDMEKYDQLLTEDIPELEDQIQDAIDSQIELKISAFETEVQLKLDTTEAEKNMREFRRKVVDQLQDDDILGNALADYADLAYYRNEQGLGVVQIYTDQLSAINQAIAEIESTGWSERFGDNINAAKEAQKEAQDNLRQALMDEQDAIKNIKDAYLSMIDKAQEKWDEQIESYNKLSNLINHDMNIIKLLYGEDKSYAMLDQYYKKQNEYNQQQLDMYVKQAALWKAKMEEAADDPELYKKLKENWENAIEGGKGVLESSIQGIIDTYTNAINEIFKELEDKLTNGLGFDELKNDWDFINEESDRYLDSINGAYEISKLEREMKDKIKDTSDLATQQKLTASMNEQLDALKQKDKLTQYDLDRANALFDIEVKKAAFKDAQQNKSKMRLRRDAQGNYSYQFVSDEDSVAAAAQELAEAQNSLYNLDKNAYKSNLDEIYEVYQDYMQKVKALYEDQSLSDKEREERRAKLTEYYNNAILGLTQQHEQLKTNLMNSTFQSLANMYGTTIDTYKNLGIPEQNELMQQTVSIWGSGIDQLADTLGEEGLYGTMQETFDKLRDKTQEYQEQLTQVTDLAEDFFPDIAAGEDLMVSAMEEMIPVNDVIINQWANMIDKMQSLAISAIAFADGLSKISRNAYEALEGSRMYDEYQKEKAQEDAKTNAQKKVDGAMKNSQEAKQGLDYNRDDWGAGNFPKIGDKVTYLGDYYFYDSLGTAPLGNRGEGQNKTVTVQNVAPNNPFPVAVMSNDSAYGWLKKYQIAKMNTGGYTGNWNSKEGKIGILHQKELVLNAYDTENFLEAIKIIERMLAQNTLAEQIKENFLNKELTAEERVKQNAELISIMKLQTGIGKGIEQIVNVNANFPNARDAEEIRAALEGLTNQMTQYAYSKSR